MSLEVGLKKIRLILLEDYFEPDLLQRVLPFIYIGANTSYALSLLAWISDASIFSNSSMSATIMSPSQNPPEYSA